MLTLIQAVHVLTGVFILAALASLLIFGIRGFRWPKTPRPNDRRVDLHSAHLLRKIPF